MTRSAKSFLLAAIAVWTVLLTLALVIAASPARAQQGILGGEATATWAPPTATIFVTPPPPQPTEIPTFVATATPSVDNPFTTISSVSLYHACTHISVRGRSNASRVSVLVYRVTDGAILYDSASEGHTFPVWRERYSVVANFVQQPRGTTLALMVFAIDNPSYVQIFVTC